LVSQSLPWWVHWQHKGTKFEFKSKTTWSTTRTPKVKEKAQESHLEEGKTAKPNMARKAANQGKANKG
jgi:hypothetical protein